MSENVVHNISFFFTLELWNFTVELLSTTSSTVLSTSQRETTRGTSTKRATTPGKFHFVPR